jgi:flagellin
VRDQRAIMEEYMSQGLSIANNLLANSVQLHLDYNQAQLQTVVTDLSTGLRINTAADDPSGLAISTNLETQAQGFNQAVSNVQNANNAAQVALGALTSETGILQRIRSLAVEAASDINSNNDRANLQTEVTQLLLEVNRISQNTNFNGQALLDGSHAGFQPAQNAFLSITANTALATNGGFSSVGGTNYGFLAASAVASSGKFNTTPNAANVGVQGLGGTATVDGTIELQVINTGSSIAVQETFINSASGQICVSVTLFGPGGPATAPQIAGTGATNKKGFDNVAITLGAFSTADVGTTTYIKVSQNVAALTNPNNPAFNFQSGADEGDVIQVGIEATNTQTLRISNINLAISSSNNPSLGAEDAIGQIDIALQNLLTQQAQLGSVVVRLNIDQDNDNTAATNLTAAESNIRDLNVGAATTEFTKLQVLVSVGTSVLAQSNANAQSVLTLFR